MLILSIRTDQTESELGLFNNLECLEKLSWQAHRQLAETIHSKIDLILAKQEKKLKDIEGLVCYGGQGSFTGLRIGMSVANALSYSLGVPVVSVGGDKNWPTVALKKLIAGSNDVVGLVEYDADPYVTLPKK